MIIMTTPTPAAGARDWYNGDVCHCQPFGSLVERHRNTKAFSNIVQLNTYLYH